MVRQRLPLILHFDFVSVSFESPERSEGSVVEGLIIDVWNLLIGDFKG
jgi:hypothetical protein